MPKRFLFRTREGFTPTPQREPASPMQRDTRSRLARGFTLVELMVMIALMLIIGTIAILNIGGRSRVNDVDLTARKTAALLRDASVRARLQASSSPWGVHFDNTVPGAAFYALFVSSYATETTLGGFYPLPVSVSYDSATLPSGTARDVLFQQITGFTSSTAIGFIGISGVASATVRVASSGQVTY